MWHVPFWRLLYVDVYVRDFVGRFHRGQRNHEWRFYASYWVKEWGEVESFYDRFYSVGGTYARASVRIEAWTWNPIEGWVCDECL